MIVNISYCKLKAQEIMALILVDNGYPSDSKVRDSDWIAITRALANVMRDNRMVKITKDFIEDIAIGEGGEVEHKYGALVGFARLQDTLDTFFHEGLPSGEVYLENMSKQQFPELSESEHQERVKQILAQNAN